MFWLTMQPVTDVSISVGLWETVKTKEMCMCVRSSQFADVCEVDKGSFLCSYTDHLRRFHYKLPFLSGYHVRILLSHDVEYSV